MHFSKWWWTRTESFWVRMRHICFDLLFKCFLVCCFTVSVYDLLSVSPVETRGGESPWQLARDRFTVNSAAAHVQWVHTPTTSSQGIEENAEIPWGVFAKRMAGWVHWRGGGGWQWCILFADWRKRGRGLVRDVGDGVRRWGQGSRGWPGREDTHQLRQCVRRRRRRSLVGEGGVQTFWNLA